MTHKNGWITLHIQGEPYQRGFQHGFLLAGNLFKIMNTLESFTMFNTGKEFEFFMSAAQKLFIPYISKEILEEMQGITDGAAAAGFDIPFDAVLAWNGYAELLDYWWPNEKSGADQQKQNNERDHCSAFIATGDATQDGGIIMAHNTWWYFAIGQYANVIIDMKPSGGYRLFMQTLPGYVHSGTDFFITGAGIVGTETTINGFDQYRENGTPEFCRVRNAMQYGKNIDEWVGLMQENNNGGYANSWLLGDIHTNEIARFEQGLEYTELKKKTNGYFAGYNAPENAQIRNLECSYTGYTDVRTCAARKVRWEQLMGEHYGRINPETARKMLGDHYDVYLEKENHPSTRTICGHSDADAHKYDGITGSAPYGPGGCVDGKVTSSSLAKDFALWGRFGRSCGEPFYAKEFLEKHPQWNYQKEYLEDRPSQSWTLFRADER